MDINQIIATDPKENRAYQKKIDNDTIITYGADHISDYVEIYKGKNYVPSSTQRSYSKIYRASTDIILTRIPKKYQKHVAQLILWRHAQIQNNPST